VTSDSLLDNYIVRLSKWLSLNPAKIIGLDKHRGSIEKHKFADLIIWDPYEASENYPYSCPETAVFHDLRLSGRISRVYVRGRLVFNEGDFIPAGKFTDNL
jgi:dihydroorotase-like cyclic amidohydrolase